MFSDINVFAVIASVIISMVVGSIWYSPSLFGKRWMEAMGKTPKIPVNSLTMDMKKLYIIQILISIVGIYALAFIITRMGIASISDAIITGLAVSIGIVATNAYGNVLWGHSSKEAFLISSGGNIIATVVISILLTIWQ